MLIQKKPHIPCNNICKSPVGWAGGDKMGQEILKPADFFHQV